MKVDKAVVLGAGPAGLAAAYDLVVRCGVECVVLEREDSPGGLCRTFERGGYRFDIGPHRFFTKNPRVDALWREVLGERFRERQRKTRIHYKGVFFDYPLKPFDVALKLGLFRSSAAAASYLKRRILPLRPEDSFETWVRNRFGDVLYNIFFKSYTRKVWGVEPSLIDAEWAAQRIRALSLGKILKETLTKLGNSSHASLISKFHYPDNGAGEMYRAMADKIVDKGSRILYGHTATGVELDSTGRVSAVLFQKKDGSDGRIDLRRGASLVSSAPLDELAVFLATAGAGDAAANAAAGLKYRSLVTVDIASKQRSTEDDNWIYLNSDEVKAGRMSLFHNWSPAMVPSNDASAIGLEYFVDEGDSVWNASEDELRTMATRDLATAGISGSPDGKPEIMVVKYSKAYPCYFGDYKERLAVIKNAIADAGNIIPIGRYGQFRYNNMDHSIETGLLAAEVVMGSNKDPWAVNEDAEYHEESCKARK